MKEIIKKLYAEELELIAPPPPPAVTRKKGLLARLKALLWQRQPVTVRVALVALVLACFSATIYYYNMFTVNRFRVRLEMAQIEAHLQRRNDLIPNLVAAVTDYMDYEKDIFRHAADVRAAIKGIEDSAKDIAGPDDFMSALTKFQAVAENYPQLKASDAYQTLMRELSNTETLIAEARMNYNQAANYYNSRLRMFPANFFNLFLRFHPVETFESEEAAKAAPLMRGTAGFGGKVSGGASGGERREGLTGGEGGETERGSVK